MTLAKRLDALEAVYSAMAQALAVLEQPAAAGAMAQTCRCSCCDTVVPWNAYAAGRCPCCGCRPLEWFTLNGNPNCTRAVPLLRQDFECMRCHVVTPYADRLDGETPAGVCPNCHLEPRSLAVEQWYLGGECIWHFDPVGAVEPNVICSRCAVVSFWADLDRGCRVCGAAGSRKVGPNAWGSWPAAQTPFVCPACGDAHVDGDRVPSALGGRAGCCPSCTYDPLSVTVAGPESEGVVGRRAYCDAYDVGTPFQSREQEQQHE